MSEATLTVEVLARTRSEAVGRAITKARQQRFDPLRVVAAEVLWETPDGDTWEVVLAGVALTEGEARELYGH